MLIEKNTSDVWSFFVDVSKYFYANDCLDGSMNRFLKSKS